MNIYMTSGTFDFLEKIKDKHPGETILLMQNNENALLLHETPRKTIFSMPRSFQVLESLGNLGEAKFVVMNHFPIVEEDRPLFEHHFKNKEKRFERLPGLIANRVLRPLKSDTYVILTLWKNEQSYKDWESSQSFKEYFNEKNSSSKQAALFIGAPYIKKYFIPETKTL
ncbi:antibiotic biosynthesis monooxygenase [Bacillus sp. FJAT-49705]|uniref:Antibiotic biosynthesis monooxygenase n=1 Tax=Cytobacillus citreus TaxID=2833586 RepID=A0ABS5NLU4_9BACI|nr:antibiotic biosynthesis monooxygenase [Cytobacillus citreus]MBS4188785.1 antibiotic biosynthesis monooxygenase [Cytobacillus citreus]